MSRKSLVLVLSGAALGASMLLMSGCKKPPPPPPTGACCSADGTCTETTQASCGGSWQEGSCSPNPCPKPPPPEKAVGQLIQELGGIDQRVTAPESLVVTEDNIGVATAVIRLADALAKGDAKAMRGMLTRPAQAVLDELEAGGGWQEATGKIEAVRIVFMQGGVDVAAASVGTDSHAGLLEALQSIGPELIAATQEALKGLSPEQMKSFQEAMATLQRDWMSSMAAPGADAKAALEGMSAKIKEAATGAGIGEEQAQKIADATTGFATKLGDRLGIGGASAATGSSMGVLLAVQEPGGAYLLGWSAQPAGDRVLFTNTAATPDVRARAAAWDGVGPEGFQAVKLAVAPAPAPAAAAGSGTSGSGASGVDGGGSVPGGEGPGSPSPSPSPDPSPSPSPAPGGPGRGRPGGG